MAGRVETSASATAVAGVATVQFAGGGDGYVQVDSIAISATIRTPRPDCSIYRGSVNPGALMAYKRAGDRGSFSGDSADRLYPSDQIVVQWTGCAPGTVCTAVLRGESH